MFKNTVFIDSRVQNRQTIVDSLTDDTQWVLLNSDQDGVWQMRAEYTGLNLIQIISHGSVGSVYLGGTVLKQSNLSSHRSSLQAIGSSLTASGDILLYGCNVGQEADDEAFIDSLAGITGADVASSDDATVSTLLNGNWILEESVALTEPRGLQGIGYSDLLASDVTVGFRSSNTSIVGGNSGVKKLNLTVALFAASTSDITVDYSTQIKFNPNNGEATRDYKPVTGNVTFAPGEKSKIISINILGDSVHEANETFYVDLVSAVGAAIVTKSVEGSRNSCVALQITNDDVLTRNTAPTGSVTVNGTATEVEFLTAVSSLVDVDGFGLIPYLWKADGNVIPGVTGNALSLSRFKLVRRSPSPPSIPTRSAVLNQSQVSQLA